MSKNEACRIVSDGTTLGTHIEIVSPDGTADISNIVRSIEWRIDGSHFATVTLDLALPAVSVTLPLENVQVSSLTASVLVSLGWTPPGAASAGQGQ